MLGMEDVQKNLHALREALGAEGVATKLCPEKTWRSGMRKLPWPMRKHARQKASDGWRPYLPTGRRIED